MTERRLAVIDCGSNSFRLVVFTYTDDWWKRTDEIHEAVRIGEGLDASGELQPEPMERALETLELYAHFCRATGIEDGPPGGHIGHPRCAATRRSSSSRPARAPGLEVEVLSGEEEARYGYLAAINSTTLSEGVVLDLGGGSLQLTRVEDRQARDARSWPLGAVRMTERFLPGEPAKRKQPCARCATTWPAELEPPPRGWATAGRLTGIGGTVRNLAAAAQLAAGLPSYGIQGFRITRDALDGLIEQLRRDDAGRARRGPGHQALARRPHPGRRGGGRRGDGGRRLRRRRGHRGRPARGRVLRHAARRRAAAVRRRPPAPACATSPPSTTPTSTHADHVARLALDMWDALAAAGLHRGDPEERELLWATAILHDIGMAVDYDDHHKHSRYLILNAGLPGFSPREAALIGQAARYHRKGTPGLGEFAPLARSGDAELLNRIAVMVRLAEQLERSRDQSVRAADVDVRNGVVELRLRADEDVTIARWAAERQADVFRAAFGRDLAVSA